MNWKTHLPTFLLLTVIVFGLQIILLKPHLNYGFTPDEWWPLAHFKFSESANPIEMLSSVWLKEGIYTTYQVLYIGLLHQFFDFNFQAYQFTNLLLKIISALVLYPLIVVIFKNRLLAFVTTILYAMAYSPIGTLELVVRGSDFIAIFFMCIFLIFYYRAISLGKNSIRWLIMLMVLLLASTLSSPIRIYPLLAFIILVETYLIFERRSKQSLIDSARRIGFIFAPYLLLFVLSPSSIFRFANVNAPEIFRRIALGNWQLLLYPLGSFGSLFLLNNYWSIFGTIQIKTITDYFTYLITIPLFIYLFIALFYLIILSIPSKIFFRFLFGILSINLILQLIVYFVAKHHESINSNLKMSYDYFELNPVFFTLFILVLSFFIWRRWRSLGENDNILFALFMGPVFTFTFIALTWIFKDYVVLFKGIHTYLSIPSIGTSLFIGSTLVLFYQKVKSSMGNLGKYIAPVVFLLLIPIFNINNETIKYHFSLTSYSMDAKEQQAFRDKLWSKLTDFDINRPALFYFNTFEDRLNGRFYEQSMLGRFSEWMFFKGNYSAKDKCILPVFILDKLDQIKDMIRIKDGLRGFFYHDYCGTPTFYPLSDFYAFRLVNKEPVDIKDEILRQLEITGP